MDQKEFSERATRLEEVGKIIEKLPTEIRSEAFGFLRNYILPQVRMPAHKGNPTEHEADSSDGASFFTKFDHDKPSDNARLIAAHLFQEYGSEPFSVEEVRSVAADVGITIPDRVDKTLFSAVENGKQLFARAGRGKFKPTVHGESYLKTTYEVKKGTKTRSADDK